MEPLIDQDIEIRIEDEHDNTEQSSKFKWSHETINLMLKEYENRKCLFRMKGTKKKDLWMDITKVLHTAGFTTVRPADLDKKFRNLKNTFITIKSNPSSKTNWLYYNHFESIFEGVNLPKLDYLLQAAAEVNTNSFTINENECFYLQNMANLSQNPQTTQSAVINTYENKKNKINSEISPTVLKVKGRKKISTFKRKILQLEMMKIKEIRQLRISMEETAKQRNKILSALVTAMKSNRNSTNTSSEK